jgi:pimeloyl-ACP methyl ester carboxylesterase
MRRFLLALLLAVVAVLALPPLWFRLFREPAPELPPPGRRVALATGVSVNVLEEGAGPAVVLVHGLPGSAYDWRETSAALAKRGRRAIALTTAWVTSWSDARPTARSPSSRTPRSCLGSEALALDDVTLVGWSYGGATAIVAAQRPSRMARGAGRERRARDDGASAAALARVVFSAPVRLAPRGASTRAAPGGGEPAGVQRGPEPAGGGRPAANFARPHTPTSWRSEGVALASAPQPDPAGIALPVLVVHGDDDRLVPVAVGRELARRAPHARLVLVPGGSHMLPITHPELLADEIANER